MRTETTAEVRCRCSHTLYYHGEDDFSTQDCRAESCTCDHYEEYTGGTFTDWPEGMTDSTLQPPTRAAERPAASPDDALHLAIKSTDSGFLLDIVDNDGRHRALSMKQDGDWLKLEPVVPARYHATLLRQKRELVKVLRLARRIVGDRAAGGRMITTASEASDVLDRIDAALNAAVGEGEGEK